VPFVKFYRVQETCMCVHVCLRTRVRACVRVGARIFECGTHFNFVDV